MNDHSPVPRSPPAGDPVTFNAAAARRIRATNQNQTPNTSQGFIMNNHRIRRSILAAGAAACAAASLTVAVGPAEAQDRQKARVDSSHTLIFTGRPGVDKITFQKINGFVLARNNFASYDAQVGCARFNPGPICQGVFDILFIGNGGADKVINETGLPIRFA